MSQSKKPHQRDIRISSGSAVVNIPPQLATELNLTKGEEIAIHDDETNDGIKLYTNPQNAPTYAYRRKIQYAGEYLVNVPARIVDARNLKHGQTVEWGEPDDTAVELTPTEATA